MNCPGFALGFQEVFFVPVSLLVAEALFVDAAHGQHDVGVGVMAVEVV